MEQLHLPHNHGEKSRHIFEYLPDVAEFQAVSDLFRQMGDGSRIRIFWILCHCEEYVINLSISGSVIPSHPLPDYHTAKSIDNQVKS